MNDIFKKSLSQALGIVTVIFTFVPEDFFKKFEWISETSIPEEHWINSIGIQTFNVTVSRVICLITVVLILALCYAILLRFRKTVVIKGDNYSISIEYGDLFCTKNGKKIIPFDECYTTQVGNRIADINATSICGQYLAMNRNLEIQKLIEASHVKPARSKSKYQRKICYESGTIVPNGNDLLMAFAKLDEHGKGRFFSYDEYIECLALLWKEIENYYAETDVYMPILGSGTTAFDCGTGGSISQQDLLDIIIESYRLSSHKIKSPHKLHIICRKCPDFSINKIRL